MKAKPISPAMHGVIDYAFTVTLLFVPSLAGINRKARKIYKANAASLVLYNSLTRHPVAVKPVMPFIMHGKIDCANVGVLALETLCKDIRKDKRAMAFHISLITLAIANIMLTDWKAEPHT